MKPTKEEIKAGINAFENFIEEASKRGLSPEEYAKKKSMGEFDSKGAYNGKMDTNH